MTSSQKTLCYVSAFINLNRQHWKHFKRTFNEYLDCFLPYIELFKNMTDEELQIYSMYLFIDSYYYNTIRNIIPKNLPITMIKCDDNWLKQNTILWNRLDEEKKIMNSYFYKEIFKSRMEFPENTIPEYTILNHCKIDFIEYTMKNNKSDIFCWVDFGYFKNKNWIPDRPFDINIFNDNKIHYFYIFPITEDDKNIILTCLIGQDRIAGSFFGGERSILIKYRKLYHDIHDRLQQMYIVDDDQHIALRCFFENPYMFFLHNSGQEWNKSLYDLQKKN